MIGVNMNIAIVNISDVKKWDIQLKMKKVELMLNSIIHNNTEKSFLKSYNTEAYNIIYFSNGGTTAITKTRNIIKNIKEVNNKIIIGSSDNDHLTLLLDKLGCKIINGLNFKNIDIKTTHDLNKTLKEPHTCIKCDYNKKQINGKILVGHLQIICLINQQINFYNKILCVYDHDNNEKMLKYYIDYISYMNIDKKIKALVFGEIMTNKHKILDYAKKTLTCVIISSEKWNYLPHNIASIHNKKIIVRNYVAKTN